MDTRGFGLFDDLVASPQWRAEQRRMYDTVVDVPRLLRFFGTGDAECSRRTDLRK